MAIYVDPARWPAHGRLYAHLISDTSLDELHAFARSAGIRERAFDRDHYDIPGEMRDDLIARGAISVSGHRLVQILRASGLRVRLRERSNHVGAALRGRFEAVRIRVDAEREIDVRETLMRAWGGPNRHYHDSVHLLAVLTAIDELVENDNAWTSDEVRLARTAAWFHDAVYDGAPDDEARSAALVGELLRPAGWSVAEISEVEQLVLMTAVHEPNSRAGVLLSDADLEIFRSDAQRYARYTDAVRAEYAHVALSDYRTGRAAILRKLLDGDVYFSAYARGQWASRARTQVSAEIAALDAGELPAE